VATDGTQNSTGVMSSDPGAGGSTLPDQSAFMTDWNKYWSTSKAGDTTNFAGGTLTRNGDGTATYKTSDGSESPYTLTQNSDPNAVAQANPYINAAWQHQYGSSAPNQAPSTTTQMQGLVNSFMNLGSQIQAPVIGGTAATGQMNSDQLVSSQLNDLLGQDSPLMQRAQAHAMEMANNRGLVNSSMATQAGQSAMIDAAMPIAQGNANTYLQHSLADQSAANQMAMANMSAQNQAGIARMQSQYGLLGQGMNAALYGVQNDANRALQWQQMQMNQNQFNSNLDNNQFNQYGNWMQQILMNPNLDQTGKQNAMDWLNARYGLPLGGAVRVVRYWIRGSSRSSNAI